MKITFDKATAYFILDALGSGNCAVCWKKLDANNFGGACGDDLYCDNLVCLVELARKVEKSDG